MEWISLLIWAVAAYFITKHFKEEHEGLNVNPWMYALGSFLFSFIISMSVLGFKVCDHTQNKNGKIISIVIGIIGVVLMISLAI